MSSTRRLNLSSPGRLVALATIAVLLPTAALTFLQYRSLLALQEKTRVVIQENLRQSLRGLANGIETDLESLGQRALTPVGPQLFEPSELPRIEKHFAAVQVAHPEIKQLLMLSYCAHKGDEANFALVFGPTGLVRVSRSEFADHPPIRQALNAYMSSQLSRNILGVDQSLFFFPQRPPAIREDASRPLSAIGPIPHGFYIFWSQDDKREQIMRAAALLLDFDQYVRTRFREVSSALLPDVRRQDGNSGLVLGVFDENSHLIDATIPGHGTYEIRMPAGRIYPNWALAIGYRSTTIEALAKANFRKALVQTLFVLAVLLAGILLTLRAAAHELRLAEAKATFVSNVSHELKTPLSLIRLFAETLELGRLTSPEKAKEYYQIIHSESRRLTHLIDNLLDFARIEAGRKEYEFDLGHIEETVAEVVRSYEYQIRSSGFELEVEIESGLPSVMIDREAISQAILNLLNNALKYSAAEKRISVRAYSEDRFVVIEVTDRGIGIPRSEQTKIFEKFYRVPTGLVHNTRGSGLGLTLVKHIVDAHQGSIRVESAPGKGSRFAIRLPAADGVDDQKVISGEAPAPA